MGMILVAKISINHRLIQLFLKAMLRVGNCPNLDFLKEMRMKTMMGIKIKNDDEDSGDKKDCEEGKKTKFFYKYDKKKDRVTMKTCGWLQKQKGKKKKLQQICKMKNSKSDK